MHCKYIACKKHNFSFPVPFGHLITDPSTADKWYFRLYFWKKKSYLTDCSLYTSVKIFLKIQLFVVFQKYNDFIVFPMHMFAVCCIAKFHKFLINHTVSAVFCKAARHRRRRAKKPSHFLRWREGRVLVYHKKQKSGQGQ